MTAKDALEYTEEEKEGMRQMKETLDFYRAGDGTNIDLVFPAFGRALFGLPEPPDRAEKNDD